MRMPVWVATRSPWLALVAAFIVPVVAQFTVQVLITPTVDPDSVQASVSTLSGPGSDPGQEWKTDERFRDGYKDGAKANARFNRPAGIANGPGGVYVADSNNHAIRRVAGDGRVRTVAGGNGPGFADGSGRNVKFFHPMGVAVGPIGEVYVADMGNNAIRKLYRGDVTTLFRGTPVVLSAGAEPRLVYANDVAAAISPPPASYTYGDAEPPPPPPPPVPSDGPQGLWNPQGVAVWPQNSMGTGTTPRRAASKSLLARSPARSLARSPARSLARSRRTPTPHLIPILQSRAEAAPCDRSLAPLPFTSPSPPAVNLIVADTDNHRLITLSPPSDGSGQWTPTLFAGSGQEGFADGMGAAVGFSYPKGVALCPYEGQYQLLIADSGNNAIRVAKPAEAEIYQFTGLASPPPPSPPMPLSPFLSPPMPPTNTTEDDAEACLPIADANGTALNLTQITWDASINTTAYQVNGTLAVLNFCCDVNGTECSVNGTNATAADDADGGSRRLLKTALMEGDAAGADAAGVDRIDPMEEAEAEVLAEWTKAWYLEYAANEYAATSAATAAATANASEAEADASERADGGRSLQLAAEATVRTLAGDGYPGDLNSRTRREKPKASLLLVTRLPARFALPSGVACDGGFGGALVADYINHRIRQVSSTGVTVTVAGSNDVGANDGRGGLARFRGPAGIARQGRDKYIVSEVGNAIIRTVNVQGGAIVEGRRSYMAAISWEVIIINIIWPIVLIGCCTSYFRRRASRKRY